MRRRVLLAAPALLAVAGTARAQLKMPPQAGFQWYAVKVEDDAFIVEMPGVPDHRILNDQSARGTPFVVHSYSLDAAGGSFVAQTALYPADVDITQPRRILQAALDGRAQSLAGRKWQSVQWREIAGAAAAESTGQVAGGKGIRQLTVLKGRRFVSLAFLGANVAAPEPERFFTSLRLS
jgi:hypothetical protein